MMRSFLLSKIAIQVNLAAVALYLVCCKFTLDGIVSYLPLVWLILSLLEVLFLFPAAKGGEDLFSTRHRVRRQVLGDPVFFMVLLGLFFVLLQTINGPRTLVYDSTAAIWKLSAARIRDFPSCLDQFKSVQGVFWILITGSSIISIRNGLGKKGRALLLKFLVGISAAVALVGLIKYKPVSESAPIPAFATFPDAVTAGIFFYMHFCVICGLFVAEYSNRTQNKKVLAFLAVSGVLNLLGVLYSLSCFVITVTVIAAFPLLIYALFFFVSRVAPDVRMRMLAVSFIILFVAAFMHIVAYPQNRIHERIAKITYGPWMTENETAKRSVLQNIATRIFDENAVVGIGTWGFSDRFCFGKYVADNEWDTLGGDDSKENCGNDALQFLVEYGVLGTLILGSPFLYVIGLILVKLFQLFMPRKSKPDDSETSSENEIEPFIDCVPPLAFACAFALIGTSVTSFFFSVFRCPIISFTWATILVSLYSALPMPSERHSFEKDVGIHHMRRKHLFGFLKKKRSHHKKSVTD